MPSAAQATKSMHAAAYTGMDDVLIPRPVIAMGVKWELYPLDVISSGGADDDIEVTTKMYITSESFDKPTLTSTLADHWIARHSGAQSKLKLIVREPLNLKSVPPVLDELGKWISPVYSLEIDSQGAQDQSGKTMQHHDYDDHYRQYFHFLPVTASQIVTARVVRETQYFQGFPQFESQYQHFLATLKRETATQQSTLKGSKLRTRRFYTAFFSFEIFTSEQDDGNEWLINKDSSQRTDVWHTKAGDVDVNMGVVSGYGFDPAQENKRLKENAKGLVSSLPGLISSMDGGKFRSKLVYIEVPFGSKSIYGHTDDDGFETEVDLTSAYKKGKKFHLYIRAPSATVAPMLPELYKWLAQFRIME